MFTKLPRKQTYGKYGRRITSSAKSIAGRLYEKAMDNTYVQEGRMPEYRPSSFPICGLLVFLRLIKGCSTGNFEKEQAASGDYFCSVGTTAHENIQFHMGFSKKIFGDWKCLNVQCKKGQDALNLVNDKGLLIRKGKLTRRNSVNNKCPCCEQPMEYVEKEIKFNGLKGHIDCIIKLDNGKYWVVDYKTTTKYIMANEKLPKKSHVKQLSTYCYVLEKKYKMEIEGFSVLYFSRDNPFNYKECETYWDNDWIKRTRELIRYEREKYTDALKALKTLNVSYIIEYKQCSSLQFYKKEICYYNDCPLLDSCFDNKKLKTYLKEYLAEFPTIKKDRIKLVNLLHKRME